MKIVCIGRNYTNHIKELNNKPSSEPVVFCKPDSAILSKNSPFYIPEFSQNIHHEIEIIVKINRLGKYIEQKFAHKYYDKIGLGIDFTARNLQQDLSSKGLPWEKAKAFDGSAIIGNFVSKEKFNDLQNLSFYLLKNGQKVQEGNTQQMLYSIDELIEHISKFFTLKIGDIIFTGTPQGVEKVTPNDILEGYLEDEKLLKLKIK